jgi:hypothetical protein
MSMASFEILAFRVQHDLAYIDMDEAARSRLDDLISASKSSRICCTGGELYERA